MFLFRFFFFLVSGFIRLLGIATFTALLLLFTNTSVSDVKASVEGLEIKKIERWGFAMRDRYMDKTVDYICQHNN